MHKKKLWWGKTGEYTPLKYIKSSGTQYIVSPVQFYGDNYKIECKFDNSDTPLNTTPFGCQSTVAGIQIMVVGFNNANSTGTIFWNGTSTAHENRAKLNVMTKGLNELVIEANNGTLTYTLNGASQVSYETYTSFEPQTENMWIFGNNRQASGGGHQLATMKFYYLRIYQNNEIKYNFISVLDSNGVPCIYDTVGKKFYYNQGTGDFTYEEWDFTPCDYVYADGNAYTSTLWYGDSDTKMEMVFDIAAQSTQNRGSMGSRGNSANSQLLAIGYGSTSLASDFNNSSYSPYRSAVVYETNKKYRAYTSKEKRSIVEADTGVVLNENNTLCTDTLSTGVLLLGAETGLSYRHIGKIYGAKIWEGDTLIRDYIPVVDGDNKGCFYDKTLNALFYSSGSSDFVGHFVESGVDYKVVKYLESTGTQYIDTGYIFTSLNHSNKYRFKNITGGSRTPYWVGGSQAPAGGATRSGGIARITEDATKVGVGIGGIAAGSTTYRTYMPTTDFQTMEIVSKDTNKFDWIVDGVKIYSDIDFTGTSISGVNEYLFAVNALGGADFFGNSTQSFYQAKENGKIVRNMIAVVNGTTAGMFDTVNRQFYGNDGTGTFNYEEV